MVGWYFSASGVYSSHGDGVLGGSGGSRWSAGIFQRQGCIVATVRRTDEPKEEDIYIKKGKSGEDTKAFWRTDMK